MEIEKIINNIESELNTIKQYLGELNNRRIKEDSSRRPRGSGNTAHLKLKMIEDEAENPNDIFLYSSFNEWSTKEITKFFERIRKQDKFKACYSRIDDSTRGINQKTIRIYFDEPSMMGDRKQQEFKNILSRLANKNQIIIHSSGSLVFKFFS